LHLIFGADGLAFRHAPFFVFRIDPCSPRHASGWRFRYISAFAQNRAEADTASVQPANSLDTLFAELKRERDEKQAKRISERIWAKWRDSGSATANLLMQWADKAVTEKKNGLALDLLDQVVVLMPATRKAGTGGRR
jgi:hypothetical protein